MLARAHARISLSQALLDAYLMVSIPIIKSAVRGYLPLYRIMLLT